MPYITPSQARQYLVDGSGQPAVSRSHFFSLLKERVVPDGVQVRLGRRILIDEDAFLDWLKEGGGAFEGGWRKNSASQEAAASEL